MDYAYIISAVFQYDYWCTNVSVQNLQVFYVVYPIKPAKLRIDKRAVVDLCVFCKENNLKYVFRIAVG